MYFLAKNHLGYFLGSEACGIWFYLTKDGTPVYITDKKNKVLARSCERLRLTDYFSTADEAILNFQKNFQQPLEVLKELCYYPSRRTE
jgi:hypothetical protein